MSDDEIKNMTPEQIREIMQKGVFMRARSLHSSPQNKH